MSLLKISFEVQIVNALLSHIKECVTNHHYGITPFDSPCGLDQYAQCFKDMLRLYYKYAAQFYWN